MDPITLYIVLLAICLVLSGAFSSSETALTALSPAKTKQLLHQNPGKSRILRLWLKYPNRVLTTILVGNNIVNTLATALATVLAEHYFGNLAITIATFSMTLALLVFGEVTPKTFAKHNSEIVAPVAMVFLLPFYYVFFPVVMALTWMASHLVRIGGGKAHAHGPAATEEDIEFMIRLGHQEGVLHRDEGELLESVMEFGDTVTREVMVPRTEICSFDKQTNLQDVVSAFDEHGHSRWPVYEENIDNIVGILYAKDMLSLLLKGERAEPTISDLMRPALFVPETMKIGSLLKEFRHGKAHLAIVADEYGGTAGIVTLEDVLEELVGEIRDEYDGPGDVSEIQKINEGQYRAPGKANISDVSEHLNIEFPENSSYDSLGGFLGDTLDKMPENGEKIEFGGWEFAIQAADEKRVLEVLISKLPVSKRDNIEE